MPLCVYCPGPVSFSLWLCFEKPVNSFGVFWGLGPKTVGRLPYKMRAVRFFRHRVYRCCSTIRNVVRRFLGSRIVSLHVPVQLVSNEATEFRSSLRSDLAKSDSEDGSVGRIPSLVAVSQKIITTYRLFVRKIMLLHRIGELLIRRFRIESSRSR